MTEETKVTETLTQVQAAEEAAAETVQTMEGPAAEAEAAPEAPVESMADYETELNASLKQIHEGDVLTGTVIGVTDTEVTLDLKYYTEGVIRIEDFTDDPNFNVKEEVHIGDEISATVVRRDGGQGQIMLSRKEANDVLAWDRLETLLEKQTII